MTILASALLVIGFLGFVVAEGWIVVALFRGRRRLRAAFALAFPALAPLYAYEAKEMRLAIAWCVAVVVYILGLVVGSAA